MKKIPFDIREIFQINSPEKFEELSKLTFNFQYANNLVYQEFCKHLDIDPERVNTLNEIPFIPISFFKTGRIQSFEGKPDLLFESSGTTDVEKSKHYVKDETIYQLSFIKGFESFYGHLEDYIILGLLPSYHDNTHSSLIYMIDHLIELTKDRDSGFMLNDFERLIEIVNRRKGDKKILIIGVSYALLDLAEKYGTDLSGCIVMETGGMKGRRKELTKNELHQKLQNGLNLKTIHSEYGMTELLSQAYSNGSGLFSTPPWMKILIREYNDPCAYSSSKSGGINVIDLANIHSCSFIATQDLGKINNSYFEVLGRFDNSDIRGCNLLIQ